MRFISDSRFSFFFYIDKTVAWFSRLNGFTLVIFGALHSLVFGVSQGSVLKTELWPIMVYFYKLWLGWRVVSLAHIPYLFISIYGRTTTLSQWLLKSSTAPVQWPEINSFNHDNAMAKNKMTNRQIIVQKTKHRKQKTKQHRPNQKLGVISGALEWGYLFIHIFRSVQLTPTTTFQQVSEDF